MSDETVSKLRSGFIVRYDKSLGLLAYSPYSGLIFAIHEKDALEVHKWLDKKSKCCPSSEYERALGPGWYISHNRAQYPMPHLLPQSKGMLWPIVLKSKWPIVINWLITGMCPLACKYCYAEDLMRDETCEPKSENIESIVKSILSYKPLVVVLTGGDPLFSPNLVKAVKLLHEHVGIVVDTCAYTFNSQHISMFKKYNIAVRISFDSESAKVNQKQRPLHQKYINLLNTSENTLSPAIKALCNCLNENITVSVQSVATSKTANDLPALGDKLLRLGVHAWRIFKIQPSKKRLDGYKELVGTKQKQKKLYSHIFDKLVKNYKSRWQKRISLQVTHNEIPNAVILVSPNGVFYTESNIIPSKVVLDEVNPKHPRLASLFNKVNAHAHVERYLNLTYPFHRLKIRRG